MSQPLHSDENRSCDVLILDDELEEFRATVRRRAEARIGPLVEDLDRTQRFSREVWKELRDLELFALPFPAEFGGSGGSFLAFIVATEEVARVGATPALYPGTTVQVAMTIQRYGSDRQVETWVPRLVSGAALAAWAFTEPQTGSDPRQLETTATPDGESWVLSGQKLFISFAAHADVALVFARTPDGGVGAFLVETSDPGWTTGRPPELMSFGGVEPAPVYLDGVRVAREGVVGDPAAGFDVMLAGEAQGKVRVASICVGIAQRAVDEAARWALQRTHRGQSIGRKFPTVQALLGQMEADVLGARALVRSAADLIDRGLPVSKAAAAARLVAGRCAHETTSAALQICGAYGLTRDLPVERLYREGKFYEVAQGVAEIQRIIVAREVLGEFEQAES